jgi:hypothetical protein
MCCVVHDLERRAGRAPDAADCDRVAAKRRVVLRQIMAATAFSPAGVRNCIIGCGPLVLRLRLGASSGAEDVLARGDRGPPGQWGR